MGSTISCVRGYKLKERKGEASRSHWGMAETEDAAADTPAVSQATASAAGSASSADNTAATTDADASQQVEMNTACDNSSLLLPKHLNAMEVRMFLGYAAKRLQRAGKQQRMVWQDHTGKGVRDYMFNAKQLLEEYPGLQLGIPLQLKWMT
jgi:hypothetical protein